MTAESRIFLNLSLEYLGDYTLPKTELNGTLVPGFADLTYDPLHGVAYALGNDRHHPHIYTLRLDLGIR